MAVAGTVLADAGRNYTVRLTGVLVTPLEPVVCVDVSDRLELRGLRLDRAVWLIQEKMGLLLTWRRLYEPSDILLIMESRNAIAYTPGLSPPAAWDKRLWLRSIGFETVPKPPAHFCCTLDFDKQ